MEEGWFVKGSEPTEPCRCHVLCDYDAVEGGICHGNCPDEARRSVGLIAVKRRFPIPILVSDAQYVYGGDPARMPVNDNPEEAYFERENDHPCGRSHTSTPFNRSCSAHPTQSTEKDEEESLIDRLVPTKRRGIKAHPLS